MTEKFGWVDASGFPPTAMFLQDVVLYKKYLVDGNYVGVAMWKGKPHFAKGEWVGLSLKRKVGNHNGTYQGFKYFRCTHGHGLFVRPSALQPMDQGSEKERLDHAASRIQRAFRGHQQRTYEMDQKAEELAQERVEKGSHLPAVTDSALYTNRLSAFNSPSPLSSASRSPSSRLVSPLATKSTSMWVWGENTHGELALGAPICGTSKCQLKPAQLYVREGSRKIVRIALGLNHSVALFEDYTVHTCGAWRNSLLGLRHVKSDIHRFKRIRELEKRAVEVCCGDHHSVAVLNNGELVAWGGSRNGKLGNSMRVGNLCLVKSLRGARVAHVDCGQTHTVLCTSEGVVYTFGAAEQEIKSRHQLGHRNKTVAPGRVRGALDSLRVVMVAAGAYHNLALTSQGEVYSWGQNNYGQLGNGGYVAVIDPFRVIGEKVEGHPEDAKAVFVACGDQHSLVVMASQSVLSFGCGVHGELGHGDTNNLCRPKMIIGLNEIKQVAAGWNHSMALTTEGSVYTWGLGSRGQLGHGNLESISKPKIVLGLPRNAIRQIAAGGAHSLASGETFQHARQMIAKYEKRIGMKRSKTSLDSAQVRGDEEVQLLINAPTTKRDPESGSRSSSTRRRIEFPSESRHHGTLVTQPSQIPHNPESPRTTQNLRCSGNPRTTRNPQSTRNPRSPRQNPVSPRIIRGPGSPQIPGMSTTTRNPGSLGSPRAMVERTESKKKSSSKVKGSSISSKVSMVESGSIQGRTNIRSVDSIVGGGSSDDVERRGEVLSMPLPTPILSPGSRPFARLVSPRETPGKAQKSPQGKSFISKIPVLHIEGQTSPPPVRAFHHRTPSSINNSVDLGKYIGNDPSIDSTNHWESMESLPEVFSRSRALQLSASKNRQVIRNGPIRVPKTPNERKGNSNDFLAPPSLIKVAAGGVTPACPTQKMPIPSVYNVEKGNQAVSPQRLFQTDKKAEEEHVVSIPDHAFNSEKKREEDHVVSKPEHAFKSEKKRPTPSSSIATKPVVPTRIPEPYSLKEASQQLSGHDSPEPREVGIRNSMEDLTLESFSTPQKSKKNEKRGLGKRGHYDTMDDSLGMSQLDGIMATDPRHGVVSRLPPATPAGGKIGEIKGIEMERSPHISCYHRFATVVSERPWNQLQIALKAYLDMVSAQDMGLLDFQVSVEFNIPKDEPDTPVTNTLSIASFIQSTPMRHPFAIRTNRYPTPAKGSLITPLKPTKTKPHILVTVNMVSTWNDEEYSWVQLFREKLTFHAIDKHAIRFRCLAPLVKHTKEKVNVSRIVGGKLSMLKEVSSLNEDSLKLCLPNDSESTKKVY